MKLFRAINLPERKTDGIKHSLLEYNVACEERALAQVVAQVVAVVSNEQC